MFGGFQTKIQFACHASKATWPNSIIYCLIGPSYFIATHRRKLREYGPSPKAIFVLRTCSIRAYYPIILHDRLPLTVTGRVSISKLRNHGIPKTPNFMSVTSNKCSNLWMDSVVLWSFSGPRPQTCYILGDYQPSSIPRNSIIYNQFNSPRGGF
jgi:hypothetical protein